MAGRNAASRELLLGLYALESGAIDQDHLVSAVRSWSRSPEKSLSEILSGSGLVDARALARLEARIGRESGLSDGAGLPTEDRPDQAEANLTMSYPGPLGAEGGEGRGTGGARFQVGKSHAPRRAGRGLPGVRHRAEPLGRRQGTASPPRARPGLAGAFPAGGGGHREPGAPRIVPVYSLNRHADGRPYYAMRLIEWGTQSIDSKPSGE